MEQQRCSYRGPASGCRALTEPAAVTWGGSQAAPVNGGLGGAGQAGSRVARGGSVSACQLLVLSPRGSSCGEQCLIRPASAPKSRSRLSPPRQEHV